MYSDAHTHFTGSPFGDNVLTSEEIQRALKNVREKGVVLIVAGGNDLASSKRVAEIAAGEDIVYASIGIHPWIAEPLDDETCSVLLSLAKNPKVVALGEIGLDVSRSRSSKEIQIQCLNQLLQLSRETGLPPIIHERGLHEELMDLLRQSKAPVGLRHGFNGKAAELKEWLDLGYYVTIGRSVLTPEGQGLKEILPQIPEDRLLLETDSANRMQDGAIEAQERVIQVARVVASWLGTTGEEIGEISTRNLKRLLAI